MHHGKVQKSNSPFYEILFIEKEKRRFSQQQEFVPPSFKWKSLLKQLWKNLAESPNNIACSGQRLIHGASASKSLFLRYEGAGALFPVTGQRGEENMIVSRRAKET